MSRSALEAAPVDEPRVLVTGGSGFIGTNLVEYYARKGARVANFDYQKPRNPEHQHLWLAGDVRDRGQVRAAVQQFHPQLVVHLAARTDLHGTALADYSANVEGVGNLIEVLRETPDLRRVVFCSSMLVCRLGYQPAHDRDYCPDTVYGESKAAGEELVRETAGTSYAWCIIRPTSIWGPWFSVPYRDFFDAVRRGWYVHPRNCTVRRSYGFVLNAVHQIATIASAPAQLVSGRTYYVADYEPLDVHAWANEVSAAFGRRPVWQMPLAVLRAAAAVGDGLRALGYLNPPLTRSRLRNLLTSAVYDLTQTRAVCPALPFSRQAGVGLTVTWLQHSICEPGSAGSLRGIPSQ